MGFPVILVCIDVFQPYILTNIDFLIRLGHSNIVVLTNRTMFPRYSEFSDRKNATPDAEFWKCVTLIAIEDLHDPFSYLKHTQLDSYFFINASMRFFYIYAYLKQYNVSRIFHIENDVLLFYNVRVLDPYLEKNGFLDKLMIPFDSFQRNIASIVYIPDANVLGQILQEYQPHLNDMQNFVAIFHQHPTWIDSFPIFVKGIQSGEEKDFVCSNYSRFGGFIFDAAAIGQYLGGVDPRNIPGDTVGFVNETCVIKYNYYGFRWKCIDGVFCPFLKLSANDHVVNHGLLEIPIFNLHCHCKDLNTFIL